MSKLDYLGLRIDLKRAEESLTERLARIEAEAKSPASADEATVAAVERMLASKRQEAEDDDIEEDFAGGTSGGVNSPHTMPWRSHLAELIYRLWTRRARPRDEVVLRQFAEDLKGLAGKNRYKKPFTAADEADVIKSLLECLAAFEKEVSGEVTPSAPAHESQTPVDGVKMSEPLTQRAQAVYDYILTAGPVFGWQITPKTGIDQSTLTKEIIPELKRLRGIVNKPGAGYYSPAHYSPH